MPRTPSLAAGVLLAAVVATGGQTARAAFVTGGPAGPASTVTFEVDQLPHGSFVANQFAAAGVAFSPGLTTGLLSVRFTTPRTTAAFTLTTGSGTHTFTAYSQDVRVESGQVTNFQLTSVSNYGFCGHHARRDPRRGRRWAPLTAPNSGRRWRCRRHPRTAGRGTAGDRTGHSGRVPADPPEDRGRRGRVTH